MLVRRGLFKTRRQVTFDNATNCGVALNTKWVPTAGMRAVLLCPGSSGVQVECRWVRHDSLNISSGWIVLQTDRDAWQAILNTMVLSARGVGDRRKGDRRNRSNGATAQNQRRQSRRLAESQSVSPLDFFLDDLNYRRESDRRGKERRGQNVPVSSDRRRGKDKRKSS